MQTIKHNVEDLEERIRVKRDKLLKESDWTQLPDVKADTKWRAYRKALRDITEHKDWPNMQWPEPPDGNKKAKKSKRN